MMFLSLLLCFFLAPSHACTEDLIRIKIMSNNTVVISSLKEVISGKINLCLP